MDYQVGLLSLRQLFLRLACKHSHHFSISFISFSNVLVLQILKPLIDFYRHQHTLTNGAKTCKDKFTALKRYGLSPFCTFDHLQLSNSSKRTLSSSFSSSPPSFAKLEKSQQILLAGPHYYLSLSCIFHHSKVLRCAYMEKVSLGTSNSFETFIFCLNK